MHARVKSALVDTDTGRTVTLREAFGHEAGLRYILSNHVSPGGAYIPASAGRQRFLRSYHYHLTSLRKTTAILVTSVGFILVTDTKHGMPVCRNGY